jgi:hypothetical protein
LARSRHAAHHNDWLGDVNVDDIETGFRGRGKFLLVETESLPPALNP